MTYSESVDPNPRHLEGAYFLVPTDLHSPVPHQTQSPQDHSDLLAS